MAEIHPFRGIRYTGKAGDIKNLVSPLFDVVSIEERERLYKEPYNSIHLSFPESSGIDDIVSNWIEKDILRQDSKAGIYVYSQSYTLPETNQRYNRVGFICNLRLYNWNEQMVLKHESTMDCSVDDRIETLEKTRMHSSPVHLLYSDTSFPLKSYMEEALKKPVYETSDLQGAINRLGIISNPEVIEKFISLIKDKNLILADGHHRYTAGLQFLNKQKENDPGYSPEKPYNFIMAYLTNLESEAIKILPTHRIIKNIDSFNDQDFLDKIQQYFHIQKLNDPFEVKALIKSKKHSFGLILKSGAYFIELKHGLNQRITWNFPEVIKELDLTILHYFIIEKVLHIKGKDQKNTQNLEFSAIFTKCISEIEKGPAQVAVITRDITMDEVKKVCFSGHTFPQKSTYFYPKVTSGLVFSSISILNQST